MAYFYDIAHGGFYCDAVHGPRTIPVRDPDWTPGGDDTLAAPPRVEQANPHCTLPPAGDLVVLSEDTYHALLEGQSRGKRIVVRDGAPTLADPPPPTIEQIAARLRAQRDALLAPITDALQRHVLQTTYAQPTTLTDAEASALAAYAQALRDVPQQPNFPHTVVWPDAPALTDAIPATPEV